ncbi:MAG: Holliday junction resolvase RuvX [Thermoanaerobacteraceae bacterium]
MRIMGLDIGSKTIGVAISDPFGMIAQGLKTINRTTEDGDFEQIQNIIKEYAVEKIVAGFPKNMNGTIGPQGEKVIKFVKRLESKTNLPVVMWDERLTTVEANRMLIEKADVSRSKRKKVIDKLAAVLILQSYLDSNFNK